MRFVRHFRSAPVEHGFGVLLSAFSIAALAAIVVLLVQLRWSDVPGTTIDSRWVSVHAATRTASHLPLDSSAVRLLEQIFGERTAAWASGRAVVTLGDTEESVSIAAGSGGFFAATGLRALHGRLPSASEPGDRKTALVSDRLWARAGRPAVPGTSIVIGARSFEVVGIAPRGFRGIARDANEDVWIPAAEGAATFHGSLPEAIGAEVPIWHFALDPRTTDYATTRSRIERIAFASTSRFVESAETRFAATRQVYMNPDRATEAHNTATMAAFAALLLVAVAFANALAAVATELSGLQRESALRSVLGATRADLLRLVLADTLARVAPGGLLALLLAPAALSFAKRATQFDGLNAGTADAQLIPLLVVVLGLTVLLFVALLLLEALAARGDGTLAASVANQRATTPARRLTAFIAVQVGVGVALIGLAVATVFEVTRLERTDVGFEVEGIVVARIANVDGAKNTLVTPESAARDAAAIASWDPDTASRVGLATDAPFSADRFVMFVTASHDATRGTTTHVNRVSAGYFGVLGLTASEGRLLHDRDVDAAVVSQSFAQAMYGEENAVGRTILEREQGTAVEIVGVVGDVRDRSPSEMPVPTVYLPIAPFGAVGHFIARDMSPAQLRPIAEQVLRANGGSRVVAAMRSGPEMLDAILSRERRYMRVGLSAAGIALALMVLGVGNLLSTYVADRRREIGVRVALGARTSRILAFVGSIYVRVMMLGVGLGATATWLVMPGIAWLQLDGVTRAASLASAIVLAAVLGSLAFVGPMMRIRSLNLTNELKCD